MKVYEIQDKKIKPTYLNPKSIKKGKVFLWFSSITERCVNMKILTTNIKKFGTKKKEEKILHNWSYINF